MAKGMLRADTFTFTPHRMKFGSGRAQRDLEEAIQVMAQGPELETNLAEATRRVMEDVNEANLAAQQQALSDHRNHLARIAELAQSEDIV